MKVKIGEEIYNSNDIPIMLILSKDDKELIGNMEPEATKYCSYPNSKEFAKDAYKKIKDWMITDE